MNVLSTDKRTQVVASLVEGTSINATCRITGVAKHTASRSWLWRRGNLHPASNCAGTFFVVARLVKIIASHSKRLLHFHIWYTRHQSAFA